MAYSTISKPSLHFNTKLYTGNGTAIGSGGNAITGVGHQPDFVWIKDRSAGNNHNLYDVLRGVQKGLQTSSNGAEYTNTEVLNSFNSDGFTVGDSGGVNTNSNNYVSWNWKANGAGSSNTDGSITSTVSVNTTAGFSIVTYEASANATIGHGLGVKPAMVITKSRDDSTNWTVWHKNLTGGNENDRYINLNQTSQDADYGNYWGTGGFTSSVFGVSNTGFHNNSNSMIAYCFAEKKGYSKFGTYTGNGNADGTFIYTGFAPSFVIMKRIDGGGAWYTLDNKRPTYNPKNKYLSPNSNNAESTFTFWDFLSNGFKIRNNGAENNNSGGVYIYMAFAAEPLVANVGQGIPATAK
jgi:hypothetical protein